MDVWIDLLKTFGLATVCLFALAFAVWKITVFVANRVLIPIVSRHIAFLDRVTEMVELLSKTLSALTSMVERMHRDIIEVRSVVVKTEGSVSIQTMAKSPPQDGGFHSGTGTGS